MALLTQRNEKEMTARRHWMAKRSDYKQLAASKNPDGTQVQFNVTLKDHGERDQEVA